MKGLLEDIRHALRVYRRTPAASLMMVAVLAIGMGPSKRMMDSVGWRHGRTFASAAAT